MSCAAKWCSFVNSDTNGRGFLRAAGSHSFQNLAQQVAAAVRDPQTGVTAAARLRARVLVDGNQRGADEETRKIVRRVTAGAAPPIGALGSGSDYTPFLQHLGIASLDIRYGGEDKDGGIYHSIYDSFDHFVRFGDPEFAYGVALAKTIGRVMLRVADADVLPARLTDFADTVAQYADEVRKLADSLRERTDEQHRLLDENVFKLAGDPTETYLPPEREAKVPFFNFAPLDNALLKLKQSAKACDDACAQAVRSDASAAQLTRVNGLLQGMEQILLHPRPPRREMVSAHDLRARTYGLRREDASRRARSHRTTPLAGSGAIHEHRRQRAQCTAND
jgi:N-acetylated-alpha-linked acidic dipeptidase